MGRKQSKRKGKERENTQGTRFESEGALGMREVYPAEEFAGFESFGEFPEWHPGQVTDRVDEDLRAEEPK